MSRILSYDNLNYQESYTTKTCNDTEPTTKTCNVMDPDLPKKKYFLPYLNGALI